MIEAQKYLPHGKNSNSEPLLSVPFKKLCSPLRNLFFELPSGLLDRVKRHLGNFHEMKPNPS